MLLGQPQKHPTAQVENTGLEIEATQHTQNFMLSVYNVPSC